MKNKRISIILLSLLLTGCSTTTPVTSNNHSSISSLTNIEQSRNIASITQDEIRELDKEYTFSVKALTQSYLKKKLQKWLSTNNGAKLIKEIEYARRKGPGAVPFKDLMISDTTLYNSIINYDPDIKTNKLVNDPASNFSLFLTEEATPYPTKPTGLYADNILNNSFTAHWNTVPGATGYKLFVNGSQHPNSSTIINSNSYNVTGLSNFTNYSWYVKAVNTNGDSLASSTLSTKTLPDKIVFSSSRNGNDEIYVMNSDGNNQTRLTNNSTDDYYPSWSPDGSKIVFNSNRDGNYEIYVMDSDGNNQTRLTNNSASDYYPFWSPDGSKVVFTTYRNGNNEIYVMDYDGTNQTRLTNNSASDLLPFWSPDGSKIVFYSNRDGNNQIYVMNFNGTNQNRISNNSFSDIHPKWR